MGGTRLSRRTIVPSGLCAARRRRRLRPAGPAALAILLVLAILATACGSGKRSATPTPVPSIATATHTPTASPSTTPTPLPPTPDPLGTPPTSASVIQTVLGQVLATSAGDLCPAALKQRWKVVCATGDVDGDGKADTAYLVPLQGVATANSYPAVVYVLRSGSQKLELLPVDTSADASMLGQALFAMADRTGDGHDEVVFLATGCTANSCSSQAHVESWDGTAWRDIGPALRSTANLDQISFSGSGASSVLTEHGGIINGPGAGPSRGVLRTFTFSDSRYRLATETYDPAVYLIQAIQDADALFDAGKFTRAIAAYQAAIANTGLKDWQQENGKGDGRTSLDSYALLRIAIATAASGADPSPAVDAVITDGQEPLFVNAAEAFRQGFRDKGTVHAGCVAVTDYLSITTADSDNPARLRAIFDYGYANLPVKTFRDICPL